jgi:hypothetical protein
MGDGGPPGPVARAVGIGQVDKVFRQGVGHPDGMDRFSADPAPDQGEGDHFVPPVFEQMTEFNRFMGTDPPAGCAPGAERHVVQQGSGLAILPEIEGICRAILDAGETPGAPVIYLKKGHGSVSSQNPDPASDSGSP